MNNAQFDLFIQKTHISNNLTLMELDTRLPTNTIFQEFKHLHDTSENWLSVDPKMAVLLSLDLDHHGF